MNDELDLHAHVDHKAQRGCPTCQVFRRQDGYDTQEIANERRKLHSPFATAAQASGVRALIAVRDDHRLGWDAHLASDECTATDEPRRVTGTRPRKVEVKPGQQRCPVCRRPVKPLPTGFLRKHKDPQGYPCTNRRPATERTTP